MQSPHTGKQMVRVVRSGEITVRGVSFKITIEVWRCEETGNEYEDEEMAKRNLAAAYAFYRAKMCLVSPFEIKEIREAHGVTRRQMSLILGFEENRIEELEDGKLPTRAESNLIMLSSEERTFAKLKALYRATQK